MYIETASSLKDNLGRIKTVDKYIMEYWNSIVPILKLKHNKYIKTITPVTARQYRFDFYGLLRKEFNVPQEILIPNMLVNDIYASTDYKGNRTEIILIDENVLFQYYDDFLKSSKRRKKI